MTYSIIVPVYNSQKYLSACLDSILAQKSLSPYEVILVDDGSSDSSGSICDLYAAKYSHIQAVHQKNSGASAARNTGCRIAQGLYILFLDSDDLLSPDMLLVLDPFIEKHPDILTFAIRQFYESSKDVNDIQQHILPEGESGAAWLEKLLAAQQLPRIGCFYAYRRAFLQEHQLFFRSELRVAEDFDLIMRCLQVSKSIYGTNKCLYYYRYFPFSLSNHTTLEKFTDDIQVKAYYFRQYPTAAIANRYCTSLLNISRIGDWKKEGEAIPFIRDNWDILDHATDKYAKLARLLFRLLGCRWGAAVFCALQNFKHRITKRRR